MWSYVFQQYTREQFDTFVRTIAARGNDDVAVKIECKNCFTNWNFERLLTLPIRGIGLTYMACLPEIRDTDIDVRFFDYVARTTTVFELFVDTRLASDARFCAALTRNRSIHQIVVNTAVGYSATDTLFFDALLARPNCCVALVLDARSWASCVLVRHVVQLIRENKLSYVAMHDIAQTDDEAQQLASALATTTALVGLRICEAFHDDKQRHILARALKVSQIEFIDTPVDATYMQHEAFANVLHEKIDRGWLQQRLFIKRGNQVNPHDYVTRLTCIGVHPATVGRFEIRVKGYCDSHGHSCMIAYKRLLRALWKIDAPESVLIKCITTRPPDDNMLGDVPVHERDDFATALRARAFLKISADDKRRLRWPPCILDAEYEIMTLVEKYGMPPWNWGCDEVSAPAISLPSPPRVFTVCCTDGTLSAVAAESCSLLRNLPPAACNTPLDMPDFVVCSDFADVSAADAAAAAAADIVELVRRVRAANYLGSARLLSCVRCLLQWMHDACCLF